MILGPSDNRAWIGEGVDVGRGPSRRETCLLSSLRVRIGDVAPVGEAVVPGGRDPEGIESFPKSRGFRFSSRY